MLRRTKVVSSGAPVLKGVAASMVTRFVDCRVAAKTSSFLNKMNYNDLAVIRNMSDTDIVYSSIDRAIHKGWNGMCLCVYLSQGSQLDTDVLTMVENGILIVKDKPALVWNSLNIFIFVGNAEECYEVAMESEERQLSPRVTQMEVQA